MKDAVSADGVETPIDFTIESYNLKILINLSKKKPTFSPFIRSLKNSPTVAREHVLFKWLLEKEVNSTDPSLRKTSPCTLLYFKLYSLVPKRLLIYSNIFYTFLMN